MSFLVPLFLLGVLAIGLPVLFHLIRRSTRERTPFSSLMFLLESPPRLTRRSRLEHLLLLALRCLALCLVAFAFARPFFKQSVPNTTATGAPRRIAVLVDTSASMRRANLWPDARARVQSFLGKTSAADQAELFSFDRELRPLLTFDQWNAAPAGERVALAMRRLAETSPGWSSTHLGNALIGAAESLAEPSAQAASGPRQVFLVTDLQEGSRLDQLQGYEWPKNVQLIVERLKPRTLENASLQLITESDETASKTGGIRVRVSNSAESRHEQFRVGWAAADGRSFFGPPAEVYVPAGQSRVTILPPPGVVPTNTPVTSRVLLQGDEEDFDNSVFVIPPEPVRLKLFYFGRDAAQDPRQPRFFLERAFQETRRQDLRVVAGPAEPFTAEAMKDAGMLIVADSIPEDQARVLHDSVLNGQLLLFMVKDVSTGPALARLIGTERVDLEEARVLNYAMLGEMDFRHPLLSGFADPRYSDFTHIHFWKYRRLDRSLLPSARVLAKFDSGDPALLEVPVGRGKIFVLTSGWHPVDSQLALSSKFVPLLYSFLELTGRGSPAPSQYHVDDTIELASSNSSPAAISVVTPAGEKLQLAAQATHFSQTVTPGIYQLEAGTTHRRLAVNLDAAESRTTPLPADELERLGAPMAAQRSETAETARQVQLHNDELEARQKLWRWVLAATFGVLLVEIWLAGRTSRTATQLVNPELGNQ